MGPPFQSATTILTDCTISGNSASEDGGGLSTVGPDFGLYGSLLTARTVLINCTVSGNSAGGNGGGVYSHDTARYPDLPITVTTLINSTVSGNSASGSGGGLGTYLGTPGVAGLGNTIIAGNTAGTDPDVSGAVTSLGNNLIGETDGSSGWISSDLTGTSASPLDPMLAPLGYYGGPTETIALLPGSAAIDAGNNALVPAGVTTDQRGFARIVNGTVDIGAFEVQANQLEVNTTADGDVTPPGELDLRQAINLANADGGAETITFDPTVFATPQTITRDGAQLELSDTTGTETITGPAAGVTVSGNSASRVFQVDSGVTATFSGLTIADGATRGNGGGLANLGTTTLSDCTVSGNSAGNGGGISNHGTLTVTSSTISDNRVTSAGGGISTTSGTATITDSDIADNLVTLSGNAAGGGIYSTSTVLSVDDSTIDGNRADGANGPSGVALTAATGGGLYVADRSTATVTGTTFEDNTAQGGNGGTGAQRRWRLRGRDRGHRYGLAVSERRRHQGQHGSGGRRW